MVVVQPQLENARYMEHLKQIQINQPKASQVSSTPNESTIKICLRDSMVKFSSNHTAFEICKPATFSRAKLNRQIILLLSSLGIEDDIFLGLLEF